MRMRYGVFVLLATCGLWVAGCGKADNTPPPDAVTDTPVLDIDLGDAVSADDLGKGRNAGSGAGENPDG